MHPITQLQARNLPFRLIYIQNILHSLVVIHFEKSLQFIEFLRKKVDATMISNRTGCKTNKY